MSDSTPTTEWRFQAAVQAHLERLTEQLVPVLRRLIEFPYPAEVECLDFEVFCDGFTDGFPVRAFFMDAANCEFFVYRTGDAEYPCDVDPGLLQLERVYPAQFLEPFRVPGLDCFTLAGEALIPWFARCWVAAGGKQFSRNARIGLHDRVRRFDLVQQSWLES